MPKRRRYKNNPYYLSNNDKVYLIEFKNVKREIQKIEVSKEIYEAFNRFELDDLKELNEYDRHLEHLELYENDLYKKSVLKSKSTEDIVEEINDFNRVKKALNSLTEVQKRRIKLYYFYDLKLREIAATDKCSIMSVKNSIDTGIKKLEKILKKD